MRTHPALFTLALVAPRTTSASAPSRDVEIVALDYAFKAPATVAAGRTTFRFANDGKVAHELNIALLKPGVTIELLAGRTYAVICIFKDKPDAKAHFAMGMFSALTIAPGTAAPGHHSFAFVNEGKQRHEVSMFMLKKGGTLTKAFDTDAAGGDMDALIETDLGLLHAPSKTSPLGLLEVDMLPGRDYHIIWSFSDDPTSKPHVMLGMLGTIHVTGP